MNGKKWLKVLLVCLSTLAAFYFVTVIILIKTPEPTFSATAVFSVSAAESDGIAEMLRQDYTYRARHFTARDGKQLYARHFPSDSDMTVLLLHGLGGSSYLFNTTCGMIREASGAEVLALDYRGHGESSGDRGDVDYTGQYEDDVADVVAAIRTERPGGKLVLAGHSMGGGIALRYALKKGASDVDAYLMFAPHLGFDSPTAFAVEPKTNASTGEPPFKLHIPRLVGLFMLDIFGISAYHDSEVIYYNHPTGSPQSPISRYTYRAFANAAPTRHTVALAAVDRPMLVLVGSNDEAFAAEQFKPVVEPHSRGKVLLFQESGHEDIMYDERSIRAASEWIGKL